MEVDPTWSWTQIEQPELSKDSKKEFFLHTLQKESNRKSDASRIPTSPSESSPALSRGPSRSRAPHVWHQNLYPYKRISVNVLDPVRVGYCRGRKGEEEEEGRMWSMTCVGSVTPKEWRLLTVTVDGFVVRDYTNALLYWLHVLYRHKWRSTKSERLTWIFLGTRS